MGTIRFTTVLLPRGPAAAVVLDDGQVAAVGEGARRFPVVATVNGYTWRTSVARMGGEFLVGLPRQVRQAAGAEAGDTDEVTLELDGAARDVEVPEPLAAALAADPEAQAAGWTSSSSTGFNGHTPVLGCSHGVGGPRVGDQGVGGGRP